jgi:hypothetical protein
MRIIPLKYESLEAFSIAKRFYSIICILNNIKITNKELELLAFCAVEGTISTPPVKERFIEQFKSTPGNIHNISSKLQRLNLFQKIKGKIRVNPALQIDFKEGVGMKIAMLPKNEKE